MNHLGDTNKMVETPRADAHNWLDGDYDDPLHAFYDFACQLERELNAANDRIQSLIEERDRSNRLAEWKWNLRDEFQLLLGTDKIEEGIEAVKELKRRIKRLEAVVNDPHALWANWLRGDVKLPAGIGDVRQYQDRIKRLEEAGDELLRDNDDMANINRWWRAKEAKP